MRKISTQPRDRRAFTLLEILVVALMIAILSSIALISVRAFMDRARLRVVAGETKSIADALQFARDDISFYPQLNFLLQPVAQLGTNEFSPLDPATNPLHPDFEIYDADVQSQTTRVATQWNGPYMGLSSSRTTVGGGPSIVQMELPESGDLIERYPGDAWSQPYVVYLVSLDSTGGLFFHTGQDTLGQAPNFLSAVVSYGPNRVPGGQVLPQAVNDFLLASGSSGPGTFDNPADRGPVRLYETINPRSPFVYRALRANEYNVDRLSMVFALRGSPAEAANDDLIKEF